jgi:hypothetical protein
MNACCRELTNAEFAAYLQEHAGSPALLESRIDWLSEQYPRLWSFFRGFADIRVANRRGSTAQARYARCPTCGETATLVVTSAPLLLLIWRTAQICTNLIVRWEHTGNKVQIERRNPTTDERAEYQQMLDEYLREVPVKPLDMRTQLDATERAVPAWRDALVAAVDLAQIWVIAHEVSHAISFDILAQVLPEFMAIHEGSLRFIEEQDLLPRQAASWTSEFDADLSGVLLVYLAELKRHFGDNEISIYDRETVGAHLAVGLGLAYDAIWQIDRQDTTAPSVTETHPPVHLRWVVASNYLKQIVLPRPEVDLLYLATTLANISQLFAH